MLTAMLIAAALAAPPSDCVKRIQEKGANDTRRVEQACQCVGDPNEASPEKKEACFKKVYQWSWADANTLTAKCMDDMGGPSQETLDVCTCTVWGLVEDRAEAEWDATSEKEIQLFIDKRQGECYKKATGKPLRLERPVSPPGLPFPNPEGQILKTSC